LIFTTKYFSIFLLQNLQIYIANGCICEQIFHYSNVEGICNLYSVVKKFYGDWFGEVNVIVNSHNSVF